MNVHLKMVKAVYSMFHIYTYIYMFHIYIYIHRKTYRNKIRWVNLLLYQKDIIRVKVRFGKILMVKTG